MAKSGESADYGLDVGDFLLDNDHAAGIQRYLTSLDGLVRPAEPFANHAARAAGILGRHQAVANIYASEQMQALNDRVQEKLGHAKPARVTCIDGREAHGPHDGLAILRVETPGAILTEAEIFGRRLLASGKLASSLFSLGASGVEPIEFQQAHTSETHPNDWACAAAAKYLREAIAAGQISPDTTPLQFNLAGLAAQEALIAARVNAGRASANLPPLPQVVVRVVSNTDAGGALTLMGNGEEHPLVMVDLAEALFPDLSSHLKSALGENYGQVGFLRRDYTKVDKIITFEEMKTNIALFLMNYDPFLTALTGYQNSSNLSRLSARQLSGYHYVMARDLAHQYLTGLFLERHSPNHAHLLHNEVCGSISLDGFHVGQRDPGLQVLATTPANNQAAIRDAAIQMAVMSRHSPQKPDIIYVPSAVPTGVGRGMLDHFRGMNRNLLFRLLEELSFADAVRQGEILPVPALLQERNRAIVTIPDHIV